MTVSLRERKTTRNVILVLIIATVGITHYIKHLSETSGSYSQHSENFAKSNHVINSLNEFRIATGLRIRKAANYCPNKGRQQCEAGIDGLRTVLGLD